MVTSLSGISHKAKTTFFFPILIGYPIGSTSCRPNMHIFSGSCNRDAFDLLPNQLTAYLN